MPLQYTAPCQSIFERTPQIGTRKSGLFATKYIASGATLRAPDILVVFECDVLTCSSQVLLQQWQLVQAQKPQHAAGMKKLMPDPGNVAQWLRDLCVLHGFVAVEPDRTYYVLGCIGNINHACVPNAYLKSIAAKGQVSQLLLVFLDNVRAGGEITIEYNVFDEPRIDYVKPWCEVKPRPSMHTNWDLMSYGNIRRDQWYFDETTNTLKVGDPDDMSVSCRLQDGVLIPFTTYKTRIFPNGSSKDTGDYREVCTVPYYPNGARGGTNWKKFREVQRQRYGFSCRCDRECFQRCIVETHGPNEHGLGSRASELFADDDVLQSLDLLAPPKWPHAEEEDDIRNYLITECKFKATVGTALNVLMVIISDDAALEFDEIKNFYSFPLTQNVRAQILERHMFLQDGPTQPMSEDDFDDDGEELLGLYEQEETRHVWLDMSRSDGLPAGMQNTGNSCFIAACVQMLAHSGCYDKLELMPADTSGVFSDVTAEKTIAHVVFEMFFKLRNYASIGKLMLSLRDVFRHYDNDDANADQNDAPLFLNCAIRCIEAQAIPGTFKRIGVNMHTVTECGFPDCQNLPSISAPTAYTDISLRMQESRGCLGRMVLRDALEAHMSRGPLIEWKCDEVQGGHHVGFMTNVCHETPKFLLLSINRVQRAYQASAGEVQPDHKINYQLDFPLEHLSFGDVRNNKEDYGSYNLLSLIRHEDFANGQSADFSHGHYITIAQVMLASGSKQWVEFNDSSVKIMSEQQVESDLVKRTVVALLYQRQNL
jgi:ubiquitin C-terminal hydrolase